MEAHRIDNHPSRPQAALTVIEGEDQTAEMQGVVLHPIELRGMDHQASLYLPGAHQRILWSPRSDEYVEISLVKGKSASSKVTREAVALVIQNLLIEGAISEEQRSAAEEHLGLTNQGRTRIFQERVRIFGREEILEQIHLETVNNAQDPMVANQIFNLVSRSFPPKDLSVLGKLQRNGDHQATILSLLSTVCNESIKLLHLRNSPTADPLAIKAGSHKFNLTKKTQSRSSSNTLQRDYETFISDPENGVSAEGIDQFTFDDYLSMKATEIKIANIEKYRLGLILVECTDHEGNRRRVQIRVDSLSLREIDRNFLLSDTVELRKASPEALTQIRERILREISGQERVGQFEGIRFKYDEENHQYLVVLNSEDGSKSIEIAYHLLKDSYSYSKDGKTTEGIKHHEFGRKIEVLLKDLESPLREYILKFLLVDLDRKMEILKQWMNLIKVYAVEHDQDDNGVAEQLQETPAPLLPEPANEFPKHLPSRLYRVAIALIMTLGGVGAFTFLHSKFSIEKVSLAEKP